MASIVGRRALIGEHRCLLDEKGRLNFPAKLRDRMGETFVVTRWLEDCLVAIPEHKWEKIEELLEEKGMVDGHDASLFIFSAAEDVTPDKQGRILLSSTLREHIGLGKDVVVVGVGSYAEIWCSDDWEKRKAAFQDKAANKAMLKEVGL